MPTQQKNKCAKLGRKKSRPAQQRYVSSERLMNRKVARLMKHKKADGTPRFHTKYEAREFWLSVRVRRPE